MYIKNRIGLVESVETLLNQEQRMNQVSNNLANVDTTGYKKENTTFWEVLINRSGALHRVGKGVEVVTSHEAGAQERTGNPLDLAINGKGYFRVQTPGGIRYTRAGNFHINNQGQITTSNGHILLGEGGAIQVPLNAEKISISPDGLIDVDGQQISRLNTYQFQSETDLTKEGFNLFKVLEGAPDGEVAQDSAIQQGFLEASNVNQIMEMTEMLDLHRVYESQQKIITIIDALDAAAVQRVGKLS